MARKAKKKQEASVFSQYEAHASSLNDAAEKEVGEVTEKPAGPTMEDLLKQVSSLNERLDRAERTNLALMASPIQQVEQRQASATPKNIADIDMKGLPDPSEDPEGYAREVSARISKNVSEYTAASTTARANEDNTAARAKALWDRFASKYEDDAKDQTRVEFAASKVAADAKAKGLDLNRYMFGPGSDMFIDDVKKKMDEVFGARKGDEDEEDGEDEADTGRTASIFGGMESSGRIDKKQKDEQGDMIKDLHDIQRKTGFY